MSGKHVPDESCSYKPCAMNVHTGVIFRLWREWKSVCMISCRDNFFGVRSLRQLYHLCKRIIFGNYLLLTCTSDVSEWWAILHWSGQIDMQSDSHSPCQFVFLVDQDNYLGTTRSSSPSVRLAPSHLPGKVFSASGPVTGSKWLSLCYDCWEEQEQPTEKWALPELSSYLVIVFPHPLFSAVYLFLHNSLCLK